MLVADNGKRGLNHHHGLEWDERCVCGTAWGGEQETRRGETAQSVTMASRHTGREPWRSRIADIDSSRRYIAGLGGGLSVDVVGGWLIAGLSLA